LRRTTKKCTKASVLSGESPPWPLQRRRRNKKERRSWTSPSL
jgi:hypothetical protein